MMRLVHPITSPFVLYQHLGTFPFQKEGHKIQMQREDPENRAEAGQGQRWSHTKRTEADETLHFEIHCPPIFVAS